MKQSMWREMFSERGADGKGYLSSKRILGTFITIVSMGCIVWLTYKDGGTVIVEGLLQTSLIMGASLLGIASVTGIWKRGQVTMSGNEPPNQPKSSNCPHCGQPMKEQERVD